jgi:hypothetical protein
VPIRCLYGLHSADTDAIAIALGEIHGVSFERRESDYFGIYWLANLSSCEVRVIPQSDPHGEDLEGDFPHYRTLIYVEADEAPRVELLDGLTIGEDAIHKLRLGG